MSQQPPQTTHSNHLPPQSHSLPIQLPTPDHSLSNHAVAEQSQSNSKVPPHYFKHPNQSNSSQTIKHLLLSRFKYKKKSLQSTSIYIHTGEIINKHHLKNHNHLLSQFQNTSIQKLPFLNNIKPHHRLSQTLESPTSPNKPFFQTKTNQNPSSSTIDSHSHLRKTKLHLAKKRSLNESQDFLSVTVDNSSCEKRTSGQSPKGSGLFLGFNEEVKKKYLKNIVDRYFQNEETPDNTIQIPVKRQSKDFKEPNKFRSHNNSAILPTQRPSFADKLPSITLSKSQAPNDPRQLRHQIHKQHSSSDQLDHSPPQLQLESLENVDSQIFHSNSSALSLSQSYLLEKIEEDEEETQAFMQEDFYNRTDFERTPRGSQHMPQLTHQTSSEIIMNSSSHDLFDFAKSSHSLSSQQKHKSHRTKIYQNRSFVIYKIKHTSLQNLSQNNNLKTLSVFYEFIKYFLNEPSIQLKKRELKAKEIILSQCGACFGEMWEEDMFDKSCIKLNISKNSPPCQGKLQPLTLSKMLYKMSPQMQSGSSSFMLIKPTNTQNPTPYITQHLLLSNSHSGLLSLLLNISLPLSQLSSSLINNKLSLNNIFYRDYNSYSVNEWSYSYFRQDFLIQDKQFEKRLEPILKNQFGDWFVTPEYLAPEILENFSFSRDQVVKYWVKRQGKKMEKSIVKEHDLFEFGNKADVWSMGLMVLEIITLIPVWIGQKCMVQNRTNPRIKPRRGLLYSEKRDLTKILTKQSYLKENLNRIIRVESEPFEIEDWLIKLLHKMLQLDAEKRISFAQIVGELSARLKK